MTRVMIAVDGSELDAPLAATAHRLFGNDADYWAVNVQAFGTDSLATASATFPAMYGGSLVGFGSSYPYLAPNPYDVREDGADAVQGAVERADTTVEEALDDAGVAGTTKVAEVGDPPGAILDAAHERAIDVVVVGDHDRSWWSKLFAPAVGEELVERAEIPVLIVSAGAADPVDGGRPER